MVCIEMCYQNKCSLGSFTEKQAMILLFQDTNIYLRNLFESSVKWIK